MGHTISTRCDAEELGHDLGRGQGLDRLAQPHVVGDQATARLGREQGPFRLVVEQRLLEQLLQAGGAKAARKGLLDPPTPPLGIAHPRPRIAGRPHGTRVVIHFGGPGQEFLEAAECVRQQRAVGVEELGGAAGPGSAGQPQPGRKRTSRRGP